MTTPEDRLAALLREESETVVPAGDGLQRIQTRVAKRRRLRWLVFPSAAFVTAAAVAAFFALGGGTGSSTLVQTPGSHGPTPTATALPTVTGGGLDHAFENPALWPFTSAQEIAAWQSTYPYADDKTALVQHYLGDVLRLTGFALSNPCESCDVVDIRVGTAKVGSAALERFLLDGHHVYTISSVGGTDLTVTRPTTGDAISNPTAVSGRITGVDEHVSLSLVTQAGATVGTGGAQAGSAVPWSGQLSWSDTSWAHAGVVAKTFSPRDGALNRLTVVPVMNGGGSGSTFTPAIWPFASAAQAQAWREDSSAMPWAGSNLDVAKHFISDYLKLTGVHAVQSCASCDVVRVVSASGQDVGTITLAREDDASPRAYSVSAVHVGTGFSVSSPADGDRVASPLTVRGTITGVDENVVIDLMTQSGHTIGHTTAPAGSGAPWSGRVSWSDASWYTGALVLKTYSAKDGSLNRLEVLRVVRGN
jgi:hypothetical protein